MNTYRLNIDSLGLVASHRRKIMPGYEYDRYFPAQTERTDPYLKDVDSVFGTLDHIEKIVKSTLEDTTQIAGILKGNSVNETCKNVFNFLYSHIQYKNDKDGVEQLRRPSRAWKDRRSGIDCDCYSIFVSSILTNLGINHALRIIELSNKGYYQHIYVIVPNSSSYKPGGRIGYYTIDPVLDKYNTEAPSITKISDRQMKVQFLNGVEDLAGAKTIATLAGLDGIENLAGADQAEAQFFGWLENELRATRDYITANPHKVEPLYNSQELGRMYDYALANLHNEDIYPAIASLDGIQSDLLEGIEDEIFGLDFQLGKAKSGGKKPQIFTKVATAAKAVKTEVKKAGSNAKKVAEVAKQGAKAVVRYNPLSTAARAGFLLAMEVNMFGIANQLRWAYANDDQLNRYGVTKGERDQAKSALAKVEKMFVDVLQGKPEMLKKAILSGKQKLSGVFAGLGYIGDFGYLGEPVTATVGTTSAMTFILKAKDIIKNLKIIPKAEKILKTINDNPALKAKANQAINKILAKNKNAQNAVDAYNALKPVNPEATPDPPSPTQDPATPEPGPTPNADYQLPPAAEDNGTTNPPGSENPTGDKPKGKKSNLGLLLFGAAAVIGVGAIILSGSGNGRKPKAKPMNGLGDVTDVEAEVLESKPLSGTKPKRKKAKGRAKKAVKTVKL